MTLKHNKAVLFANGDFPSPERLLNQIADGDFLVAVDGGLSHMTRHGLSPDLIIGDLDSATRMMFPDSRHRVWIFENSQEKRMKLTWNWL